MSSGLRVAKYPFYSPPPHMLPDSNQIILIYVLVTALRGEPPTMISILSEQSDAVIININ